MESERLKQRFSLFVWRHCKEERERFENQLCSIIEKLTNGKISGRDLASQTPKAIADALMQVTRDLSVLFVFDNVDQYMNLETRELIGSAAALLEAFLTSNSPSQVVFP